MSSGIFVSMRNFKLVIEYDGTDYVGWQYQRNGRSIQEVIEKALGTLTQQEVRVAGAGRTDAGVHARGQVANAFITTSLTSEDLLRGLNALLPHSIVVHSLEEADARFQARRTATSRSYRYVVLRRRSAMERNYGWYLGFPLEAVTMQECAAMIVGDHNFQSFCKSVPGVNNYQCQVMSSVWTAAENRLYYDITANRFFHGMVRTLVGSMVDVGRGYRTVEHFRSLLEGRNRALAGMAAPSKGLFLEGIGYEKEW